MWRLEVDRRRPSRRAAVDSEPASTAEANAAILVVSIGADCRISRALQKSQTSLARPRR